MKVVWFGEGCTENVQLEDGKYMLIDTEPPIPLGHSREEMFAKLDELGLSQYFPFQTPAKLAAEAAGK